MHLDPVDQMILIGVF